MTPRYERELLELRRGFPSPVARPDNDSTLLGTLDAALRAALALRPDELTPDLQSLDSLFPDPQLAAASRESERDGESWEHARLPEAGLGLDAVVKRLVGCLSRLPVEVHPKNQVNVNAQPSTGSLAGALLPALFNPNMSSDGRGAGCSRAEREIVALVSRMAGCDPGAAGGVFTFGGTGTMLYGVRLGLETAIGGVMRRGLFRAADESRSRAAHLDATNLHKAHAQRSYSGESAREVDRDAASNVDRRFGGPPVVLASERSHHTVLTAAGWLGIGQDQVRLVPVGDDHAIDVATCERIADEELAAGRPIAAIVATLGTTDAFGLDDLTGLHRMRERLVERHALDYRPHLHADSVIGWAWTVFRDYDFARNPLEFDDDTLAALRTSAEALRELHLADSFGVDFHKTAFCPYVSSAFVVRDRRRLELLARQQETMPYLFHSGGYHPGMFTLETTRSAVGVLAALGSLLQFGERGMQVLLGRSIAMTRRLRRELNSRADVRIVNEDNVGPVTLFRVYPPGVDPRAEFLRERTDASAGDAVDRVNELNHAIHTRSQQRARDGAGIGIGWTRRACRAADGRPIAALKSYLLSPFLEPQMVDAIARELN